LTVVLVAGAVTKDAFSLVPEWTVQLDHHAKWLVVVVGAAATTSQNDHLLASSLGQPVWSLDPSNVAILQHALDPGRDVTECVFQQIPPAVPRRLPKASASRAGVFRRR